MATVKLRAQLDNHDQMSDDTGLDTGTEGGAKQSFKQECDINTIVKRFGIGYDLPATLREPQYGDFTESPGNFHEAMNRVAQAREAFELLPADMRAKHDNDPGKWVDFMLDPANIDEIEKRGALSKEAQERRRLAREAAAATALDADNRRIAAAAAELNKTK